ncbi:hypothetical protein PVAP13_9NG776600 [Panicum virgatum]|uniref:Uncharacterized protein n=1 Tax=Panicum virgatum TaxID=38727 RepID=A0A8T0N6Z0_PANVG|nr:hypothetical protein PVAP13_9NG776600 [Panicum virgatum]
MAKEDLAIEAGDKPRLASKFAELGICKDLVEACKDLMGVELEGARQDPGRGQACHPARSPRICSEGLIGSLPLQFCKQLWAHLQTIFYILS